MVGFVRGCISSWSDAGPVQAPSGDHECEEGLPWAAGPRCEPDEHMPGPLDVEDRQLVTRYGTRLPPPRRQRHHDVRALLASRRQEPIRDHQSTARGRGPRPEVIDLDPDLVNARHLGREQSTLALAVSPLAEAETVIAAMKTALPREKSAISFHNEPLHLQSE